ncbi:hypothetical protein PAXINDRAFT_16101 [Paxillus involutus ATCC 200175]|uniref:Uncharacterized protein n=1 Tax=Paxillus involutus ATCC 200175 TaxID=664439 RepID=A0A0C9T5E9_PAXIN|nr:hypothetical protein PAXINDRAFT_16101 [Paxillus involutus ATCC 200175]
MPYLNYPSIQRLWTVDQLIQLYLEEDVHNHILIEPIGLFNHVNDPLIRDAPVTAHKIVLWPTLAGTWLEHPDHPQNLAVIDVAGPTGSSDIYINETTVSVLEALNLPVVTESYDDVHLSRCLVHHQGYEKSSIGLKYKIHYSLRTYEDDYDIHPFYYTNRFRIPTTMKILRHQHTTSPQSKSGTKSWMQMLAEDIGLSEEASNSMREWPRDQRCWLQQSLLTPHSLGTKSVNTRKWKKKSLISSHKRALIIKKSEENQKTLMERKSFQAHFSQPLSEAY